MELNSKTDDTVHELGLSWENYEIIFKSFFIRVITLSSAI